MLSRPGDKIYTVRICAQPMSFGQGKMALTLQSTNYVLTKLFYCRTALYECSFIDPDQRPGAYLICLTNPEK